MAKHAFISIENGEISVSMEMTPNNETHRRFPGTPKGAAKLGRFLAEQGIVDWVYSSSVDFPTEENIKKDFDVREAIEEAAQLVIQEKLDKHLQNIAEKHKLSLETLKEIVKEYESFEHF